MRPCEKLPLTRQKPMLTKWLSVDKVNYFIKSQGEPIMGLKEDYLDKIEPQIREWAAKINELKAKAEKGSAEMKIKMTQEIEDLRARKEAAQQKLAEMRAAGAEKWESLKTGTEKAVEEWKKKWESLKSKYL
jgi:chromosome segregation ATPase